MPYKRDNLFEMWPIDLSKEDKDEKQKWGIGDSYIIFEESSRKVWRVAFDFREHSYISNKYRIIWHIW